MNRPNSKYDRLKDYLRAQSTSRLPMTFADVENIVGARLPRSAKLYRTWWSNDGAHHVQASAWLGAGYRTEQVDMENTRLVFVRENAARGMAEEPKMFDKDDAGTPKQDQHPMIGALKGTFSIEPGWDLTKPALDPEELDAMEANLDRTADLIAEGLRKKTP